MRLATLSSTPLSPLASRFLELSREADELWIATAFCGETAVREVVTTALEVGASVRFLTGTFGRVTRHRTFKRLHQLGRDAHLQVRVWDGDFHAKLYLWRKGNRGIAWLGSANLTSRGMTQPGELVAEVAAGWNTTAFKRLRSAFETEWGRADPLGERFLRAYKESSRRVKPKVS